MKLETLIPDPLRQRSRFSDAPHSPGVEAMVEEFEPSWRALGRALLDRQMPAQVEAVEQHI